MKEIASLALVLSLELLLDSYQYTSPAKLNHTVQIQNNFLLRKMFIIWFTVWDKIYQCYKISI
jgi:hypothetical protein